MRGRWMISGVALLTLAGCGEHRGWNPNYSLGSGEYGKYLVNREVALVTDTPPPARIPIVLPAEAPTAQQIAGKTRVPAPYVPGRTRQGAAAPQKTLPVSTSGPYPGSTPVLVRYAYSVEHKVGTPVWPRVAPSVAQAKRVCASFATADAAQITFLSLGGPQRDQRLMDPDGDGFVCGWNPATLRKPGL